MKRKTMVPVAIVLLVLLDQLVKWYVVKNIPLGVIKSFVPHVVSLTYLQNTGAAFSLLENQQWFFTLITLVVMVGACTVPSRRSTPPRAAAWSMSALVILEMPVTDTSAKVTS